MKSLFFIILLLTTELAWAQQKNVKQEEVSFYNGNIKLAATLYLPSGKGPFPALAVTHGSGKEGKSQPGYISLATKLANQGFATLIFDKRGVGASGGDYVETPEMSVPAGDLVEAVRYLKQRPEIDKAKVGVYGHSQGGWVAPLASVISNDISFVAVSCGGGISNREQVLYALRADLKKKDYSTGAVDSVITFARKLYTYLGTGIGYGEVNPLYEDAVKRPWFKFFTEMQFRDRLPPPSMLKEQPFNFFKMINYDPQATLRAMKVPTLVILAEKDEAVPTEKAKQLWEDAFYASGRPQNLMITVLPGENHYCFERTDTGVVYKKSFEEALVKWLKETLVKPKP